MDGASHDDADSAEDGEVAVLLRLVEGDISFQQWSAEHLSDIARAAEAEGHDESSDEDESILAKIPELVAEITDDSTGKSQKYALQQTPGRQALFTQ